MRHRIAILLSKKGINTDDYLTIVALEDGLTAQLSKNACEYCVNGDGNWKSLAAGTNTETINTGQKLSFRGNLTPTTSGIGKFTISKKFNLEGNCMSMLFGDDAVSSTSLSGKDYAFQSLFALCTTLKNISANFLPATTLASGCYNRMFADCTNLTTAPALPATTIASTCYEYMFSNCTNLTQAPALPATTLVNDCYKYMFRNCSNLTQAPALPAKTIAHYCYVSMFEGCTKLITAPELPATTLTYNCYHSMFYGCTSLTTAPKLPAKTLSKQCYYNMFSNCTNLTQAPALPATKMENDCYGRMFYGCTKLTTAPALPATTLANYCYEYMFYGCKNLTRAPELPAKSLSNNCYNYMFQNCTKINYIKAMFTTTPTTKYTNSWVSGVASSGTFVKNKNATWNTTGVNGIPSGWTVQTA